MNILVLGFIALLAFYYSYKVERSGSEINMEIGLALTLLAITLLMDTNPFIPIAISMVLVILFLQKGFSKA